MNFALFSSNFPGFAHRRSLRGFTLTEMLVTLAIVILLGAIALPSFRSLIGNQKVSGSASDLLISLTRARSEAIKRNIDVTVTPTSSSGWQSGWSIADSSAVPVVLERHAAVAGVVITGPSYVTYQSTGRLRNLSSPSFNVTGVDAGATGTACVRVDLSGLPNRKASQC